MSARLAPAMLAAGLIAIALMVLFESTLTRVTGVLAILAFIVLGVFAIATPEFLDDDD